MEKKEVSWNRVVIGLFLFPPVGLYYLVKKSKTNRAAGTLLQIYGWFSAFMFLILYSAIYTNPEIDNLSGVITFFAVSTILSLGIGFKNKRRIRRCDKYIDYIKNNRIYSIDKMAELKNTNYDAVLKDLKFILSYSYLKDIVYLDVPNRVVVPKNMQQQSQMNTRTNQQNFTTGSSANNIVNGASSRVNNTMNNTTRRTASTGNRTTTSRTVYGNTSNNVTNVNRTKVVRCSGCGASGTVTVGIPTECEYCGVPLNA